MNELTRSLQYDVLFYYTYYSIHDYIETKVRGYEEVAQERGIQIEPVLTGKDLTITITLTI